MTSRHWKKWPLKRSNWVDVEYDGWGTYYEDPNGEDEDSDEDDYEDEDDDGVRH